MNNAAIQKLKVFFKALADINFKPNLYNIPTPTRVECLNLLRKLPQFQADRFKNDNVLIYELIDYLKDPTMRKRFLEEAGFTSTQQEEFRLVLEKPVEVGVIGEQVVQQEQLLTAEPAPAVTEPIAAGGVAETPAGGVGPATLGIPTIPSTPYVGTIPSIRPAVKPPEVKTYPKKPPVETGLDYEGKPYEIPGSPKIPSGISSAGKNLGSQGQIFTKKGTTNFTRGFSNVLGGLGQVAGGGGRRLFGFGLRAADLGTAISNRAARGNLITGPSKKVWLWLLIGFLSIAFLTGFIGAGTPPTKTPAPGTTSRLDYTLPLRDPTITVQDIQAQVSTSWPNAQIQNWQTIIDQAVAHKWNPAVLLTIWIEESGAQGQAGYTDPLGCDVGKPTQDIQVSLNCFFNNFDTKFSNDQFYKFMLTYSAPNDPYPFKTNPSFPSGFKSWYQKLVPSGPGAIVAVAPSPSAAYNPAGGSGILSCPVNGGRVTTGSINTPGGHCSPSYLAQGLSCVLPGQPNYTGRDTAVDVKGSDRNVFLPNLGGNPVNWTVDESGTDISDNDGGGVAVGANADYNGHNYRIRFVHLESASLKRGQTAPSSTLVGQHLIPTIEKPQLANHVHITIQEAGVYKPADLYFNLCQ